MPENKIKVVMHYRGTFNDGTEFKNSYATNKPIRYILGSDRMLPAIDAAIAGMSIGDKTSIHVGIEDAYGEHDAKLVRKIPRAALQGAENMVEGQFTLLGEDDGKSVSSVKVLEITDKTVTIDSNHPLAGQELNFDIEIIDLIEIPAPGQPLKQF